MPRIDQTIEGRERNSQKKSVKLWLLLASGFLVVMILISIFGEKGLLKVNRLKKSYINLGQEVEELTKENEKLSQEIQSLKNDPIYIESIARTKLGLVKPNEIVYQFLPKEKLVVDKGGK